MARYKRWIAKLLELLLLNRNQQPPVFEADRVGLQGNFRWFCRGFTGSDIKLPPVQRAMNPVTFQATQVQR